MLPKPAQALMRRAGGLLFVIGVALVYGMTQLFSRMGYQPSQDSLYHFSVAQRIWQGDFHSERGQDLPWTLLAQLPVDHYFGYHALIAPFAIVPDPEIGMKLATLTLFVGVFVATYLFLRARGVANAWVWALLPGLFANQDWRYLMLRGGHLMVILSFAFLHVAFFVASDRKRRLLLLLLSYFAMLCYQGALILLPLHLGGLLALALLRRDTLRPGQWLEPVITLCGFALGLTLNPYMDAHASTWQFALYHVTKMSSDPEGLYPGLSEFGPVPLTLLWSNPEFIMLPGAALVLALVQVVQWRRGHAVDVSRVVMAGAAFAGIVIAARAIRMREYAVPWIFAFLSTCVAPRYVALRWGARGAEWLSCLLLVAGLWLKWPQSHYEMTQHLPIKEYKNARPLLQKFVGHPVLNIAEGDYTTLRWEYPDVACVQGLSRYFLFSNRPVFDDVWALRDSQDPRTRMQILARFYDRGVRLLAVQHRNAVFGFAESYPKALHLAYRSRFDGPVAIKGSSIYLLDRAAIQAAIELLPVLPANSLQPVTDSD